MERSKLNANQAPTLKYMMKIILKFRSRSLFVLHVILNKFLLRFVENNLKTSFEYHVQIF